MSAGKILVAILVISAVAAGAGIYYTQVYAYYEDVAADAPAAQLRLTSVVSGEPETFIARDLTAIDKTSSPLAFRACFTTPMSIALMTETYQLAENAVPLTGPGWFDCYDAVEVGEALEAGRALAFLGEKNIRDGVDRVIAILPDGRGFAWHQLNAKYKE